ncbi:hypothetical protein AURDEDRAFT_167831 [Auricularia subglabra TFB-10046 SS5]|nr:hypothetical protein AURDEDRAFT_167831 [Auricularia subglabra TFB-10046 SS5]
MTRLHEDPEEFIASAASNKFKLFNLIVRSFTPPAIIGSALNTFSLGKSTGPGVENSVICGLMDRLTSARGWTQFGTSRLPPSLPYGHLTRKQIANLRAAGFVASWSVSRTFTLGVLSLPWVLLQAASEFYDLPVKHPRVLRTLVDTAWIATFDVERAAALSYWPLNHCGKLPPYSLRYTNKADTKFTRSFHASATAALFTLALVNKNLVDGEVPSSWSVFWESFNQDIWGSRVAHFTRVMPNPPDQRTDGVCEIVRIKLILTSMGGTDPLPIDVQSRVVYKTQSPDFDYLVPIIRALFDQWLEQHGHPQAILDVMPEIKQQEDERGTLRAGFFARTATGNPTFPAAPLGPDVEEDTSLQIDFFFSRPLVPIHYLSPFVFHVCMRQVEILVNQALIDLLVESKELLDAEPNPARRSFKTPFGLFMHQQILTPVVSFNTK